MPRNPTRALLRIPVPWVYVLTYLAGVGLEFVAPLHVRPLPSRRTLIAGAVLLAAGAVVAGWAWALFHRAGTTRVPGQSSKAFVVAGSVMLLVFLLWHLHEYPDGSESEN